MNMKTILLIFSLILISLSVFVSAEMSCLSDSDCKSLPTNRTTCSLDESGRYCATKTIYQCCTDESTDIACFYYPDSPDAQQNIPGKCIKMGTSQECYFCLEECNGGKCSYQGSLKDINKNGYYDITNCVELQTLKDNLHISTNYELLNDIDCSDTKNWNNGAGFEPIGTRDAPFLGNFEGNNKTISNLYINRPSQNYIGLFGILTGAKISNIGLISIDVRGNGSVGGLVGSSAYYSDNPQDGTIINAYSTGKVQGSGEFVGGLVGYNYQTLILNSHSAGKVNGDNFVGGLVGDSQYSQIEKSYSSANVWSDVLRNDLIFVGSLVGDNGGNGVITDSYSIGSVNGGWLLRNIYKNIFTIAVLLILGIVSFFINWKDKSYVKRGRILGFMLGLILFVPNLIKFIIFKDYTIFSYSRLLPFSTRFSYILIASISTLVLTLIGHFVGRIIEKTGLRKETELSKSISSE